MNSRAMYKIFSALFFFLFFSFSGFCFSQETLENRIDEVYNGLSTHVSERVAKIPKISLQGRHADRLWRLIDMSLLKNIRLGKKNDILMYQAVRTKIKERDNSYLTDSNSNLIKQWELINAINNYRTSHNMLQLNYNSKLSQIAYRHANDLANNFPYDVDGDGVKEIISHRGSDGTRVVQRAEHVWYIYSFLAENIAYNQITATQVLQDRLNSPTHYNNIVSQKSKEIGVAKVGPYRVMVIGSQRENV